MVIGQKNLTGDSIHPSRSVLPLSIALSDNPRTRPVLEGRVRFEALRLIPTGVSVSPVPLNSNLGDMLLNGEIDAIIHYIADNNLVDRSRVNLAADSRVKYLFDDREAESARYFKKTGIFPINHIVVVKRSVYEQNPWIALNLYSGFVAAMDQVRKDSLAWMAPFYEMGLVGRDVRRTVPQPPMPYRV